VSAAGDSLVTPVRAAAGPSVSDGYQAFRDFVNPLLAARAELMGEPWQLVRVAADGRLVDVDGRMVEDLLAGWGTQAFGHRPAAIERALTAFLAGDAPSYYPSSVSPWAGLLARALCQRVGAGAYDAAFFASGGTEAVEAALKLARAATGRPRILALQGAFHGCTYGSLAMMHDGAYRAPFGPALPLVDRLPFDDVDALERALAGGDVAAVVVEPIQVEAGVRVLGAAYVAALGELTARAGALLVADEIQTGLGRTGRMLASDGWPRRPDVVTLGKALGGGLMPVSAVLTRRQVFAAAYGTHATAESHASTFSGNALACVAALAALDLLTEDVIDRVAVVGARWRAALAARLAGLPLLGDVRGDGLLVGIELGDVEHPWLSFEYLGLPELGGRSAAGLMLVHRLFRAGYGTGVCGHDWTTLRLQPALVIDEARLDGFVDACGRELEYLCQLG